MHAGQKGLLGRDAGPGLAGTRCNQGLAILFNCLLAKLFNQSADAQMRDLLELTCRGGKLLTRRLIRLTRRLSQRKYQPVNRIVVPKGAVRFRVRDLTHCWAVCGVDVVQEWVGGSRRDWLIHASQTLIERLACRVGGHLDTPPVAAGSRLVRLDTLSIPASSSSMNMDINNGRLRGVTRVITPTRAASPPSATALCTTRQQPQPSLELCEAAQCLPPPLPQLLVALSTIYQARTPRIITHHTGRVRSCEWISMTR